MKIRKSIVKRFKITKSGKIMRRRTGQDHLLAKKSSAKKRGMRRWTELSKGERRAIKKFLKY